jgi:3-hydroxybutyryl-CoA dehydrogenase
MQAWLKEQGEGGHQWLFLNGLPEASAVVADMALVMEAPLEWIQALQVPALVNETILTFAQMGCTGKPMARFCGWPTFWERSKWEVALATPGAPWLPDLAQALGRSLVPVADTPGLVAPRVLAMLFNEACFGLADGICSAADMDTAMQLGTNYPRGPVAWMEAVGRNKVGALLQALATSDSRYLPHSSLQNPTRS